jgi:hypothetical protein
MSYPVVANTRMMIGSVRKAFSNTAGVRKETEILTSDLRFPVDRPYDKKV